MKASMVDTRRSSGAILIVLLVGMLAGSGFWLLEMAQANRQLQHHRETTAESLAFAKEALIAYAVNYADNYGHNVRGGTGRLPCPARVKHSGPGLSCGKGKTGYLPAVWSRGKKRIDIDHVEKFLDQDLWYSVSPTYRFNPSYNALNSDSQSDLISVGNVDEVVAVIIAPGPPIQGQDRLRENAGIADYLEGENANQDLTFSAAQSISGNLYHSMPTPAGNDQLIWIMQSELLPLMERRVLGYVKQWLDEYYLHYGYYPYAAPFENANGDCQPGLVSGRLPMERGDCVELPLSEFVSTTVAKSRTLGEIWFSGSLWPDFIYYQVDPVCTSGGSTSQCDETTGGTLIVDNDTVKVLLVNSGEAIESVSVGRLQSREIENRSLLEYFEVPGLLAGDSAIAFRNLADTANDQYVVIR